MTSFYQFFEQMQLSKLLQQVEEQVLTEMRPMGSYGQYGTNANPHKTHTAIDGNVGRNTSNNPALQDTPAGEAMDKTLKRINIEKHMSPEQLAINKQVRQKSREDSIASREDDARAGYVGDGKAVGGLKGKGDIEAQASTNRGDIELLNIIDNLQNEIEALKPQVKNMFDPRMMKLVKKQYQATSIFDKQGKIGGEKAEEIEKIRHQMAKIISDDADSGW
jgi:hypothetical protein